MCETFNLTCLSAHSDIIARCYENLYYISSNLKLILFPK